MISETVVAPDMNTALRIIKRRYGEDALILGTRSRNRRKEGALALIEEVEVDVGLGSAVAGAQTRDMGGGVGGREAGQPAPRSLETELQRVEELLDQFEADLDGMRTSATGRDRYPLSAALERLGIGRPALEALIADHVEEVPPANQAEPHAAIDRLGQVLACVEPMSLSDLRGHHALLGAPGVGKTALAHKLAGRVAAGGARVVVLSYDSRHEGENLRLERAATELGFEAAVAPDRDAFLGALRYLKDRDLVIIDMPPLVDAHWALLSEGEAILKGDPLLRHLVLAADGGWRQTKLALQRCDFLALTRADLASPLLPGLELAGSAEFSLSFVAGGCALDEGLDLAAPDGLLAVLRREFSKADGAEAGRRA